MTKFKSISSISNPKVTNMKDKNDVVSFYTKQ